MVCYEEGFEGIVMLEILNENGIEGIAISYLGGSLPACWIKI